MSTITKKTLPVLILVVGTFIGIFKGAEARQKWIFKMRNRCDEKKQTAEREQVLRTGGVALDDIEWAAFHR